MVGGIIFQISKQSCKIMQNGVSSFWSPMFFPIGTNLHNQWFHIRSFLAESYKKYEIAPTYCLFFG